MRRQTVRTWRRLTKVSFEKFIDLTTRRLVAKQLPAVWKGSLVSETRPTSRQPEILFRVFYRFADRGEILRGVPLMGVDQGTECNVTIKDDPEQNFEVVLNTSSPGTSVTSGVGKNQKVGVRPGPELPPDTRFSPICWLTVRNL